MRRAVTQRRRVRWPIIAADLADAGPGHVFLAGDSHAELLGVPDFGLPIVNAGIGGIETADYARDLQRLDRRPRAAVAVLLIGSNDTHRVRRPASARRRRSFAATIYALIEQLRAHSDVVLVTAIPPVGPPMAEYRDLSAATEYSAMLKAVSVKCGCVFIDPFAHLRGQLPALAAPDAQMDPLGVHLADYSVLARALAPAIEAASTDGSRSGPFA